jgi:hypothetical protein
MSESRLDVIEKAYHKEGFKTVDKGDGAISFAKEAPVVVIVGRKGGEACAKPDLKPDRGQSVRKS